MGSDALKNTQANLVSVPWMQDVNTRAFNETLGSEKDRLVDRAKSAVKMRWGTAAAMQAVAQSVGASLDHAEGDPERLRHLGATFDLERLGSMTDAQYDDYLESTWNVHSLGGTAVAIVGALHAYGIVDVDVAEEWMPGGWPGWGGTFNSHRLRVIVGPNFGTLGWGPMTFPFPLDGTAILGVSGVTQTQLNDIAHLVRRWKDAAALPLDIVFRFAGSLVLDATGISFQFTLTDGFSGSMPLVAPILGDDLVFPFQLGPTYLRG